jgi:hypothetical protein
MRRGMVGLGQTGGDSVRLCAMRCQCGGPVAPKVAG